MLDLREGESRDAVGLSLAELSSEVGEYEACHRIGQAAYELGLHGVIAPAAGGLGETLAIFDSRLPASEQPRLVEERTWEALPADPRVNEQ